MLKSAEPRPMRPPRGSLLLAGSHPGVAGPVRIVADDPSPRVRLEAVRAASFYRVPAAVDVALAIRQMPTDYYLDYCLGETLRQLEPVWRGDCVRNPDREEQPAGSTIIGRPQHRPNFSRHPGLMSSWPSWFVPTPRTRIETPPWMISRRPTRPLTLIELLRGPRFLLGKSNPAAAAAVIFTSAPAPNAPDLLQGVRARLANLSASGASPEFVRPPGPPAPVAPVRQMSGPGVQNPAAMAELSTGFPFCRTPTSVRRPWPRFVPADGDSPDLAAIARKKGQAPAMCALTPVAGL